MQMSNRRLLLASIGQLIATMVTHWPDALDDCRALLIQMEAQENIWDRCNWQGHITASAVLINTNNNSILFIEHIKLGRYLLPGGHCDPFEMPVVTANRELTEETGISSVSLHSWHMENSFCPIDLNSHRIPFSEKRNEPEHMHHDFRYVFVTNEEHPIVDINGVEISNYKWHSLRELKQDYPHVLNRIGDVL